ncbi:MAG: hypothetical protein ACYTG1_00315 [Planctomycetota bacterium]|jgi:hypothetical protein
MSMAASLLFWAALLLPGYAVIRRWFRDDLDAGLPGTIALSFLAALAVLTPLSIACYLLRLPLAVFTAGCVLAVGLAVVDLSRGGGWRDAGRLVTAGLCLELLVVAVDMVLGFRVGTYLSGDAVVHLGRVRFLLDHGFSNLDPNIAAPHFYSIYHTNLLHALLAAADRLTPADHLEAWVAFLAWTKLLVAGAVFCLARRITGRDAPAWAAVVFTIVLTGPVFFMAYPNKLAPWFALPLLVAFAARAWERPDDWRGAVRLAAGVLVVGQLHGLYALFAFMILAPPLLLVAVLRTAARRRPAWPLLAAVVAVAAGLPFPVVTKATSVGGGSAAAAVSEPDPRLVRFDNGWVMRDPSRGFTHAAWRPLMLGGALVAFALTTRRRAATIPGLVVLTVAAILFTPPLCTLVLGGLGQLWILMRLEELLRVLFAILVPAAAGLVVVQWRDAPWARAALGLAAVPVALAYEHREPPLTWPAYADLAAQSAETRRDRLARLQLLAALTARSIPPGATVLAEEAVGQRLVMVHDCHLVSAKMGSMSVPDLGRRRRDLETLLADDTAWPERRALLDRYGIRFLVPRQPVPWVRRENFARFWMEDGINAFVVELDLDGSGAGGTVP